MKIIRLKSHFEDFDLPSSSQQNISAIVPTVSKNIHCYFFMNFRTSKGICVKINMKEIINPGLKLLSEAYFGKPKPFPLLHLSLQRHHYHFNFFEQIMLMTSAHTVTEIGQGRFIVGLSAYYGFILVDCRKRTADYFLFDESENHVLGSKQYYDPETESLYIMTASQVDSDKKMSDPYADVFCRIQKYNLNGEKIDDIWDGNFNDYVHDLNMSPDKKLLIACDFGMFTNEKGEMINSKILVLDLINKKEWIIPDISNAAHIFYDPDNCSHFYLSNHNFQLLHTPFIQMLLKGAIKFKFTGPASVHKYQMTSDGPVAKGIFSHPELFRMTNSHVFYSHGEKVIAASGEPNFIFIARENDMKFLRKLELKEPGYPNCFVGTFFPSVDGNYLYVQTTRSFQIINVLDGSIEMIRSHGSKYSCNHHMELSEDTDW